MSLCFFDAGFPVGYFGVAFSCVGLARFDPTPRVSHTLPAWEF